MASNAPCKRCLVIPGPGKCLSKLFKMKPMLHSADHKNYIKPKLKDLKNIIWRNSYSNLFNRECTRMVLRVTKCFLRLRRKLE